VLSVLVVVAIIRVSAEKALKVPVVNTINETARINENLFPISHPLVKDPCFAETPALQP